ncbi:MAG: hypothetical protein V4671_15910 [Armatimonadota bacterium]
MPLIIAIGVAVENLRRRAGGIVAPITSFLKKEDGDRLLSESGDRIVL